MNRLVRWRNRLMETLLLITVLIEALKPVLAVVAVAYVVAVLVFIPDQAGYLLLGVVLGFIMGQVSERVRA